MKIFITIPSFARHGGIRIIMEWANRLAQKHEVTLHSLALDSCSWFKLNPEIKLDRTGSMKKQDCLIITSPHAIHFQNRLDVPGKVFISMQMVESMFRPHDLQWQEKCRQFYLSTNPLFSISQWNMEFLKAMNRRGKTHYIGNGVNFEHFPIEQNAKDGKTVLVEGWDAHNPTKDSERVAHQVANRLRRKGYRIIAYGAHAAKPHGRNILNEYFVQPDTETLNRLYSRATILLKATKYDARSCSPVEAMTKGTVTARGITLGDDDLIHDENCMRCEYHEHPLFNNALRLLQDKPYREQLSAGCISHVLKYDWEYWMPKIEKVLCQ